MNEIVARPELWVSKSAKLEDSEVRTASARESMRPEACLVPFRFSKWSTRPESPSSVALSERSDLTLPHGAFVQAGLDPVGWLSRPISRKEANDFVGPAT